MNANREVEAAYERLLLVATGEVAHLFAGACPDEVEGFDSRDPECPACIVLEQPGPGKILAG